MPLILQECEEFGRISSVTFEKVQLSYRNKVNNCTDYKSHPFEYIRNNFWTVNNSMFQTPIYYSSINSSRKGLHVYLNKNIQFCIKKKNKDHLEISEACPPREGL